MRIKNAIIDNWSLFECNLISSLYIKMDAVGGTPGLVVMGGDLCSKGHKFESRPHILDGQNIFPHIFL